MLSNAFVKCESESKFFKQFFWRGLPAALLSAVLAAWAVRRPDEAANLVFAVTGLVFLWCVVPPCWEVCTSLFDRLRGGERR